MYCLRKTVIHICTVVRTLYSVYSFCYILENVFDIAENSSKCKTKRGVPKL